MCKGSVKNVLRLDEQSSIAAGPGSPFASESAGSVDEVVNQPIKEGEVIVPRTREQGIKFKPFDLGVSGHWLQRHQTRPPRRVKNFKPCASWL